MKKEIMEQWVEALRSGKYAQGDSWLRRTKRDADGDSQGDEFCCLGVLCDLAPVEIGEWQHNTDDELNEHCFDDGLIDDGNDDRGYAILPKRVLDWAEMRDEHGFFLRPIYIEDERFISLVVMNDKGRTFEEIADVIEANFEEL